MFRKRQPPSAAAPPPPSSTKRLVVVHQDEDDVIMVIDKVKPLIIPTESEALSLPGSSYSKSDLEELKSASLIMPHKSQEVFLAGEDAIETISVAESSDNDDHQEVVDDEVSSSSTSSSLSSWKHSSSQTPPPVFQNGLDDVVSHMDALYQKLCQRKVEFDSLVPSSTIAITPAITNDKLEYARLRLNQLYIMQQYLRQLNSCMTCKLEEIKKLSNDENSSSTLFDDVESDFASIEKVSEKLGKWIMMDEKEFWEVLNGQLEQLLFPFCLFQMVLLKELFPFETQCEQWPGILPLVQLFSNQTVKTKVSRNIAVLSLTNCPFSTPRIENTLKALQQR